MMGTRTFVKIRLKNQQIIGRIQGGAFHRNAAISICKTSVFCREFSVFKNYFLEKEKRPRLQGLLRYEQVRQVLFYRKSINMRKVRFSGMQCFSP